jgi:hypothetical protein
MMRRYFFDLVGGERSEYDYSGRVLPSAKNAQELAELIAVDLALEDEEPWCGWKVKVRSAEGHEMFCVPVQPGYLAAA